MDSKRGLTTKALHTFLENKLWDCSNAVVAPITTSAIFRMSGPEEKDATFGYNRYGNPTLRSLEATLASIEGGKHANCFATGMAAATAVVTTFLQQGDHVIAGKQIYGGIYDMFKNYLPKIGVDRTFLSGSDLAELRNALTPKTKLVWFEPCSNPTVTIVDVEAIAKVAHEYNKDIIVAVDNTFLSPYAFKPLTVGIDLVYHSISKYLNGHSDVLMGCLITNCDDMAESLQSTQRKRGLNPGSFDCYLVQRSLATLELRMQRHESSSLIVAHFLESHPAVSRVKHPQLPSHPQHALARRMLGDRYCGMVAFYLKGGDSGCRQLLANVRVVTMAASLGGTISVANKPTSLSHVYLSQEEKEEMDITDDLIRLSVGLENPEDIIADLKQALDRIS